MLLNGLKRMTSAASAAFVLTAVVAIAPVQLKAETLADALASAYKHSGLLDKNRALLRAADEDVAVAMSALRPIVNWSGDLTYTFSRSTSLTVVKRESLSTTVGLSAQLLLWDGGATRMRVDAAKETVLATRQGLLSVEQQVFFQALGAYLDVKQAAEAVQLRQSNQRVINVELRAARDRFEVGEVTRTDVSLAEARQASARAQLAAAQGELARAVESYRAAVGHKPGNLTRPASPKLPVASLDAAKAYALRLHPDMKRVQHQVTAAELGILIAEAAKQPTVNLTGNYGLSETFNSTNSSATASVGIGVSGPIYQGGRLSALERRARAQRDAVRGDLHITRHSIAQNVGAAWAQMKVAQATVAAGTRQVRAAELAFRGVREEATLGARTTLDVLDAEQELLNARNSLLTARYDVVRAGYTLLGTMGLLTAEQLNLNVPRYDPAAYFNLVKNAPTNASKQGQQLDRVLKKLGKE